MKHLLYSILVLALFSCSKDEPEKPNTPPQAFEVTAKAEGSDVILTWTEAVDADGDAVKYAVVYGADTLAKGLTARTYTFKDLPYETNIAGTVVASDGRGGKTESGFKVKTGEEPWDDRYVKIPDVEFEKFLIKNGIDDKIDGSLERSRAKQVKKLDGGQSTWRFESVAGIEAFEDIEEISFYCPNLKKVDFQNNLKLKKIMLSSGWSGLESINLKNNKLLESLSIFGNPISEIDLSNNTNLRYLYCPNNRFKSLDLSKNQNLESINLEGNSDLSNLTLGDNIKIKELDIANTKLNNIDFKKLNSLISLSFSGEYFKSLDISQNVNLEILKCRFTSITNINFENNVKLKELNLYKSNILELDLSKNLLIEILEVDYTKLKVLKVDKLLTLRSLKANNIGLLTIDITKNKKLFQLELRSNQLTSLDLRGLDITYIDLRGNKLGEICLDKPADKYWQSSSNWQKEASAIYKVCD